MRRRHLRGATAGVQKSVMPKGVEHSILIPATLRPELVRSVQKSVTPKGVEHEWNAAKRAA